MYQLHQYYLENLNYLLNHLFDLILMYLLLLWFHLNHLIHLYQRLHFEQKNLPHLLYLMYLNYH
jgi:hypothetical protein